MFMPSSLQPAAGLAPRGPGQVIPFPGAQAGLGAPPGQQDTVQAIVRYLEGGGAEVDLDPSDSGPSLGEIMEHGANLAEHLPESILTEIAETLLEGIEADISSNSEMTAIYEEGVKLLGIRPENRDQVFYGACGDYHPMLMQAVIRAQAEMRAEMLPPAGPVKNEIVGDDADMDELIANRRQTFLNYYLTEIDEGYYPDFDQMLLLACLHGSMFRKVYTDPLKRRPLSRGLTPQQLIVGYATDSLDGCGRVTQVDLYPHAEVRRMQLKRIWRDINLADPIEPDLPGDFARNTAEGRVRSDIIGDDRHTIYECHADIDIEHPGVQHLDPTGEATGLPLPFIATIDYDSRKILRLTRNWEVEEQGEEQQYERAEYFVHFKLCPGLGFYGWGYLHFLASSASTATKMRRQIIDCWTLGNFPGGFMSNTAKGTDDDSTTIGPCEFRRIDTGGMAIQDVIMGLPYKDVSTVAPEILQEVVSAGEKLGGTTDLKVGEGNQMAPVGTTLALLEQAARPTSAMMQRMHTARCKELRLLAKLFAKEPTARYPYKVGGKKGVALASDFADVTDIVPVSDPNSPTQTQRMMRASAELQMAVSAPPGTHDIRVAFENVYKIMGKTPEEIAKIMPLPQQAVPLDPVSEFEIAMKSGQLKAGPQQQHAAHIQAHLAQLQIPAVAKSPAGPLLLAHIAEHMGLMYRAGIEAKLGQPLPPPGQPLPPQVEAQLSMMVAKASTPVALEMAQIAGAGADPAKMAELEVKKQQLQQDGVEGERKAASESQQNQTELIKLRHEGERAASDNATRLEERRLQLQMERVKAWAGLGQAHLQARTEQTKAVAGLFAGIHDVTAEHIRQTGAVKVQNAAVAAERVKGHHAVRVAQHDASAAKAAARTRSIP